MSGTNFIPNPSPVVSTTGWTVTNGTITRQQAESAPGSGGWCGVIVAGSSAVITVSQNASGLTVGQPYMASLSAKIKAGSYMATNGIGLYMTAAGYSSLGTQAAMKPAGLGEVWVRIKVGFIASSATQTISVVTDAVIAAGALFYVDRMMVGAPDEPYFDGSYPQCAWTGTAYASTSTCAAFANYPPTTEEPVLVGGVCLNTMAWNVVTRSGRLTIPTLRGSDSAVPGQSGLYFVPNRPYEAGLWALGMWILGMAPDGTIPQITEAREVFERNLAILQQAVAKAWQVATLVAWQADGTVRQCSAVLAGQTDGTAMMGGIRAEYALIFEILASWWDDAKTATTAGTAGAGWSNQTLSMPALAGGTAPIEDAVAVVQGPAVNPRLTSDSGVWVQLNDSLTLSDTWTVDSGAWTSQKNSTDNVANVTHAGHPRFIAIPPGEQLAAPRLTLTCSGSGATTNLSVTARRHHWDA